MNDLILLLLLSLTTFRLTWFVTRDSFPLMRMTREKLLALAQRTGTPTSIDDLGHDDPHGEYVELRGGWSWVAELITCYWCVSVWLAAGVVGLTHWMIGLNAPLLWLGATAALSALIAALLDRHLNGGGDQ